MSMCTKWDVYKAFFWISHSWSLYMCHKSLFFGFGTWFWNSFPEEIRRVSRLSSFVDLWVVILLICGSWSTHMMLFPACYYFNHTIIVIIVFLNVVGNLAVSLRGGSRTLPPSIFTFCWSWCWEWILCWWWGNSILEAPQSSLVRPVELKSSFFFQLYVCDTSCVQDYFIPINNALICFCIFKLHWASFEVAS